MNRWLATLVAIAALAGARLAREAAANDRPPDVREAPYSPSPAAAPIVTLGYRELAADLMWVRLRGYFASNESTSDGVGAVVEAIVALDPRFERVYEFGARAMTMAQIGVDQRTYL